MPSSPCVDEIENVLSYYHSTFLREIPRLYAELEHRLGRPVAPFFRMGNWIGGDRDGNPNVNADTLRMALRRQGETALRYYLTEAHELGAELSISRTLVGCTADLQIAGRRVRRRQRPPRRRALPPRAHRHLRAARGTLHALTGTEALRHAVAPGTPYAGAGEFLADLRTIDDSLRRNHGAAMIGTRLGAAHPRGRGLRLPPRHHRPAPELRPARGGAGGAARRRAHRARLCRARRGSASRSCCSRLLQDPRGLRVRAADYSESDPGRAGHLRGRARAARRASAPSAITPLHHQPHRDGQRPAGSARCCRRKCGLLRGTLAPAEASRATADLIVVPLFETIDDLRVGRADHARLLRPARHRRADAAPRAPSRT